MVIVNSDNGKVLLFGFGAGGAMMFMILCRDSSRRLYEEGTTADDQVSARGEGGLVSSGSSTSEIPSY